MRKVTFQLFSIYLNGPDFKIFNIFEQFFKYDDCVSVQDLREANRSNFEPKLFIYISNIVRSHIKDW